MGVCFLQPFSLNSRLENIQAPCRVTFMLLFNFLSLSLAAWVTLLLETWHHTEKNLMLALRAERKHDALYTTVLWLLVQLQTRGAANPALSMLQWFIGWFFFPLWDHVSYICFYNSEVLWLAHTGSLGCALGANRPCDLRIGSANEDWGIVLINFEITAFFSKYACWGTEWLHDLSKMIRVFSSTQAEITPKNYIVQVITTLRIVSP